MCKIGKIVLGRIGTWIIRVQVNLKSGIGDIESTEEGDGEDVVDGGRRKIHFCREAFTSSVTPLKEISQFIIRKK
jgi:hypothetical protein